MTFDGNIEKFLDTDGIYRIPQDDLAEWLAQWSEAKAEIERLKLRAELHRRWRDDVTSALQNPGGSRYDEVPQRIKARHRVMCRLYEECDAYADGAIDASRHDRLCCEVSDSLRPFVPAPEPE